jgi:uncharacterized protein (TIGR02421 family)
MLDDTPATPAGQKSASRKPRTRSTITSGRKVITDRLIAEVAHRLDSGKRVRRALPDGGRLHIDRQLPFLCVYRQPDDEEDRGTEGLVTGEASYLVAPGSSRSHRDVAKLIREIARIQSEQFGGFLIVEMWAKRDSGSELDPRAIHVSPTFEVTAPGASELDSTIETLVRRLNSINVQKVSVDVETERGGRTRPDGMKPLLSKQDAAEFRCVTIGIAVPPVYRDETAEPTQHFPLLLKTFRRRFGLALRRAVFEFVKKRTTSRPPHFHVLGRRAVVQAVWQVDRQLADVGNQFDYLLNVTPINNSEAWREFRRLKYEKAPVFHYLPLPFDPPLLKRELFRIPIEKIEDPALANLFREKQEELDRKITMLRDRNTPRFLLGSRMLFGGVSDELLALAQGILSQTAHKGGKRSRSINANEFAEHAEREFAAYREVDPEFSAGVSVNRKVAGMMVSRGKLIINHEMTFPLNRVDALVQHEIGTHLVTWHNGVAQPFRQLESGLAGYEELQEGLAVLSEYMVGGLSRDRIRQLAGRVVAVKCIIDGATFVETFRTLVGSYGFQQRPAYTITMRVFRGGGLTKDAVYLRGLQQVIAYVQNDGDLEPLFVGKMAADHIPIIRELQHRKVLKLPPIRPRYMQRDDALARLEQLRESRQSIVDLISDAV